jgi:hypothetical protein
VKQGLPVYVSAIKEWDPPGVGTLSADRDSYSEEPPVCCSIGSGGHYPLEGGQAMVARKLFVFFVVAVFSLGLANLGHPAGMGEDVIGIVTKIEGGKVSIMDKMGSEKTIEPKNPEALKDLKVGDQASVKDSILTKMGSAGPSAPSPGHKY